MSKKRKGDTDDAGVHASSATENHDRQTTKKRKREVDVELVKVYDDLADEQESVRLAAAYTLLSKIYMPGTTDLSQTRTILTRLFRGLCSSRKSARLGFSVALTELLSQLIPNKTTPSTLSLSEITDILEAQSAPELGTSGQEERDHYFGRVFGVEAMLKSGLVFSDPDQSSADRLVDILCALALKKPWLRQECGWVLYNCVGDTNNNSSKAFAAATIDRLIANKLIRTPEGVAVWLAAERRYPNVQLPTSAWKGGNPLAKKNITVLAEILKDARAHPDQQDSEEGAQGSARWSASLHFAWDVVLVEIFSQAQGTAAGKQTTSYEKLSFELFWSTVVDSSLFADTSSPERKAWGFSLWRKVFETAPERILVHTFTSQATRYLANSLKSSERLLQRSAQRVTHSIQQRLAASESSEEAGNAMAAYVVALLSAVAFGDFDQITKSKTLQSLIDHVNPSILAQVNSSLLKTLSESSDSQDDTSKVIQQKSIINLQWKMVSATLRRWEQSQLPTQGDIKKEDRIFIEDTLGLWLQEICVSSTAIETKKLAPRPVFLPQARDSAKERLGLAFERAMKLGSFGCTLLSSVLLGIHKLETSGAEMTTTFEPDVHEIVQTAWNELSALSTKGKSVPDKQRNLPQSSSQNSSLTRNEALHLLYCLLLFQTYSGEPEAAEILQEVLEYDVRSNESKYRGRSSHGEADSADSFMEILLSFASKPSKLLRRTTIQIFEAFAAHLTIDGLESLFRVLETKENVQGQQEMFQAEDAEVEDGGQSDEDVDVDEMDSDVEVESKDEADDESANVSDSEQEASDDEDEELAKFDAALASALGTRNLNPDDLAVDDSDSSSDADMDDDEMTELDSKLAEVFRARSEQQNKNKKKDAKDAKENIVNFKNRVLDLIESYFRVQPQNSLTIDLLLPLLQLARVTQVKQLAERCCQIIQQFSSKCKGLNVPELEGEHQTQHSLDVLKSVHEEACRESSNAQSNAASLSSILVVKVLIKADPSRIKDIIQLYASTRMKQLTEKKCRVLPGFFTDWNNWCQTAKERLAS